MEQCEILGQVECWEARREVQNLVGKYANYIIMKREHECVSHLWSAREDITLGLNNGFYCGKKAVSGYYDGVHAETMRKSELLARIYPDQLGKMDKTKRFGVGQLEYRPFSTGVVEVAGDLQTAKALWYSQGIRDDLTVKGPLTFWTFGIFAVDFFFEDGAWKIWHLLYLEDINNPCGTSWGRGQETMPVQIEMEIAEKVGVPGTRTQIPLKDDPRLAVLNTHLIPSPTRLRTNRELYHRDRPYQKSPRVPEPYETFAQTFSYGC